MLVNAQEHTSAAGFTLPDDPSDPSQKVTIALKGAEGHPVPATIECDCYMAAMGRYPNTSNVGLDTAGVTLKERTRHLEIEEGKYRCLNAPTVFGAGDVRARARLIQLLR